MAKKTSIKVRLVPEGKPDSPFFYYVKKPNSGEKAKVKLKVKLKLKIGKAKDKVKLKELSRILNQFGLANLKLKLPTQL